MSMPSKFKEGLAALLSEMPKGSALHSMNFSFLPGTQFFFLTSDVRSTEVIQSIIEYGTRHSPLARNSMQPGHYACLFPEYFPVEKLYPLRRVIAAYASLTDTKTDDLSADETRDLFSGGGKVLEALASVAGLDKDEVIAFAVKQAEEKASTGECEV
ncbi:hypothetical protein MPI44_004601 [Klebsiella oxytoca]|nr:hypothetical protein [Klebsiella oxytoca]